MSVTTRLTRNVARFLLGNDRFLIQMPAATDNQHPVFLTFDDGPHREQTPRVLDSLAATGAKATFFVLGPNLAGNEGLIRRMISEGHAIGSHGWGHQRATEVSAAEWLVDAKRGISALEDTTGRRCHLFRPAFGELTPRTLSGLLQLQQRIVLWSQDVHDYLASSRDEFCDWFSTNGPYSGSIVLMHDNQANTAEFLQDGLDVWSGRVRFEPIVTPDRAGAG